MQIHSYSLFLFTFSPTSSLLQHYSFRLFTLLFRLSIFLSYYLHHGINIYRFQFSVISPLIFLFFCLYYSKVSSALFWFICFLFLILFCSSRSPNSLILPQVLRYLLFSYTFYVSLHSYLLILS